MTTMTRRTLIATATALPLASLATPTRANAPALGDAFAMHRRFSLGDFEVTMLLAGTNVQANPHGIFGLNTSDAEFAEVSAANFLSADASRFFFCPVVVNTGENLILFDTGLNARGITGALENAGYTADQIDTVVITHMHGDHIGGLIRGAAPTFANATYVTGRVEYDFWAGTDNAQFDRNMRPLADRTRFLEPGQDVQGGITAVEAFGHTPGHMVYHLQSNGAQLMLLADLANHPVWSLAHPDWEVRFDRDKPAAAASRRRLLDMVATDRIPSTGYHLPFPALGYVAQQGDGFLWVPESGQLMG